MSSNDSGARGPTRLRADRARVIADRLRQKVVGGAFASGVLPDEQVLAGEFEASRNAVREALRLLSAEGLVVRRPGLGTRVVARKFEHSLDRLAGLAETLTEQGTITNEVRTARLELPPPEVAARLGLVEGERALYLERLRTLAGQPLSLDLSYIVADIGIALLDEDLQSRDVFALIEETSGTSLGTAEVTVHAVNADVATASTLEIEPDAAVFQIDRLTRLADSRPVDLELIYLRGDRISLNSVLHRAAGPAASTP
ncbi:GntR family transcriptional regulator [Saxibacter everestensis]|uniref:GntR family transcriptional regulator n=1 Tax=Saxibacter everestensis TaxID=2909229 RepID=A0ABY8QT59_9MICO|nr:GntR family transcriptional regulator [Brevibacteriaceae bacterium ZFBP1038]